MPKLLLHHILFLRQTKTFKSGAVKIFKQQNHSQPSNCDVTNRNVLPAEGGGGDQREDAGAEQALHVLQTAGNETSALLQRRLPSTMDGLAGSLI